MKMIPIIGMGRIKRRQTAEAESGHGESDAILQKTYITGKMKG